MLCSVLESPRIVLVEYLWNLMARSPPLPRNGLVWLVVGVAKLVALPTRVLRRLG